MAMVCPEKHWIFLIKGGYFMMSSRIWLTITIILTLLLGLVLGTLGNRLIMLDHWYSGQQWTAQDIIQEHLLARLSRKLDLRKSQIQAIGGILRLQAVEIKNAKHNFQVKLMHIKEKTQNDIEKHLYPKQREKFTRLITSHQKRWKKICQQ